jgi:protein tyrosine/serine phosphatase
VWCAAALAGLAFAVAAVNCGSNLREVDAGSFYRSGQLGADRLRDTIDALGIKTIINLRGVRPQMGWYRDEVAVAREKGVRLISLRFGADRLPHRRDLVELLDALRDAERPILVHCRAGADRSGVASAIYQMEYMGRQKQEALEMLTLRYFHIAWLRPAKRYFIERYQGEEWARTRYDPCGPGYQYYDKHAYCGG